jgi:hypothetical protein
MNEPAREILRIGDILRWAPGITEYQLEKLIENGLLHTHPYYSGGHRRFLKSHVYDVVIKPLIPPKKD